MTTDCPECPKTAPSIEVVSSGAFSPEFAAGKRWKIDQGLLSALLQAIPEGASVIDLGAGIGRYVQALRDSGRQAWGVDGIEGIAELSAGLVAQADLSNWAAQNAIFRLCGAQPPEWALCIEVGEHVPESKLPTFLDNICTASGKGLIVSWGNLGQRGHNHVSCHSPEWVVQEVVKRAWRFDELSTVDARSVAGKGWNKKLLVFRRGLEKE